MAFPRLLAVVLAVPLCALPFRAMAQAPLAPPPQTPYGMPVSTEDAKRVAAAAIAEARRNSWNMAVALVDSAGYLVYFERMPNTQLASIDLAIEKARSAALFRRPTKLFQDAVANGGDGLRVLRLTGAIPNEGGVPIIVEGKLVGAIGISGGTSEQDGQAAKAGASSLK
jgi:glc operon protein GlcG